nr:CD1375 family protein [Acutalibacter sp. M00204]
MSRLRKRILRFLLRKEVEIMAVVYATLIIKGRKTLEQVPALIREQVKEILADLEVEV